ncbi:hypothetical protein [Mesorhizobium captivum]|uniref:hypothetical protein n=1 Tax=Mesorhizobium captivum TaxID=3072319 RepID=UPI003D6AEC00
MQPPVATPERLKKIVDQLGLHWGQLGARRPLQAHRKSQRPAPFAAAAIATRPDAELFAWWLADLVLACAGRGRCRS